MIERYSIPFTEYVPPNGETRPKFVTVSGQDAERAKFIVDFGWKFEVELLSTGLVSMTVSDGHRDVAIALAKNDNKIYEALSNLITETVLKLRRCVANDGKVNDG